MYTYNPYAYNLPKAQDGMNIRGARNQFREQENATKDAANWFKDAGKWALNTVVAPFEILSGTNFYDPDMSYKGWEGFDNVFEGVSKGVGEALGYFYGGPAYGAVKEGISGIAGMFGGSKEYGGPIEKYQTQGQVMAPRQPIGANPNGSNVFSFQQGFNTPEQMQSFANLMSNIMGVYGSSMQTQPTQTQNQTTDISKNNLPQPNPNPNATGVSDATGPNMDSIGNLMKGIAGAGKDPIQGNTVNYGDPEVAGNAGAGIKHFVDSIAGNDPKDLAFQKGHQDRALAYLNASKSFIPSVTRAEYGNKYQMGGTAMDPMKRAAMVQHHSQGLHTPADQTAEIGHAFHGLGESIGKAISGGGMSGGGGGGGIMNMFGGGGDQGGMMGNIMGMFGGGGEGGSGGGGFMDMIGGMFGGESGDNFNFGNIMGGISNLGGMLGFEYGGDIPLGEPVPVRKGKSPYIATYYYEDGGKVPSKYKGFSKLPEEVQKKINPSLAEQYMMGGKVKDYMYGGMAKKYGYGGMLEYENGGKMPKNILASRLKSHMSDKEASEYLSNYERGGKVMDKTSELPDMDGFVMLSESDSDIVDINNGRIHENGGTKIIVPVNSPNPMGNFQTEYVPIEAEKGESIIINRKNPFDPISKDEDIESVIVASTNLKDKLEDTPKGMFGNTFAKNAKNLGKKREKAIDKLKSESDPIALQTAEREFTNAQSSLDALELRQNKAKEIKEEEDRMDLFQLAKNGGRITKKNTYRMGGKIKKLSEYQKDLLGMNDEMPMAQYGWDNLRRKELWGLTPEERKAKRAELKLEAKQKREKRKLQNKEWREGEKEARRKELEEENKESMTWVERELSKKSKRKKSKREKEEEETAAELDRIEFLTEDSDIGEGINRDYTDKKGNRLNTEAYADDLAKEIAELSDVPIEDKPLAGYTTEGAKKAKELIEEEFGPLTPTGGLPEKPAGGVEIEEEEEPDAADENMMRRMSSGSNFLNDYINRMNAINASVRNRFEPYPNFYADYAREAENLMANAETDLPRYYEDMMAQKASQSVNALENAIRNMSGIGSSGYLANMQAARNKELGINQQAMATSLGQEMAQRNARAAQIAQNRLYEARGAETSFDRNQEALDAMDTAEMITARNILEANIARERERNQLAQNNLLAQQMGWMNQTNPTMYDAEGNEIKINTSKSSEYGGAIKKRMYEYGSRIKKERSQKADKAIQDFRSFMKEYNK